MTTYQFNYNNLIIIILILINFNIRQQLKYRVRFLLIICSELNHVYAASWRVSMRKQRTTVSK